MRTIVVGTGLSETAAGALVWDAGLARSVDRRMIAVASGGPDSVATRQATDAWALVRDGGSQFIDAFDEIIRTEGMKILKTPIRIGVANTFAERWIGSLRREFLDRTIIWNQHQLEQVIVDYTDHYNHHRSHRSFDQWLPRANREATARPHPPQLQITKSTRWDGLVNEYRSAA